MTHFDFIVFENYILATHHLYDVELIARMLHSRGLRVAIFDVFHQWTAGEVGGVPVIHWQPANPLPDTSWMKRKHSKIETLTKSFVFRRQYSRYMKDAMAYIQDRADRFYCGSYHNGLPVSLLELEKPCYWWGLRSERMRFSLRKMLSSPMIGLRVLNERRRFLRNPMQRLFVSNPIIMDEHERLGVPRDRMVIREERVVEHPDLSELHGQSSDISFLTIGLLRPEKHVTTTIEAFRAADINNSTLRLTGRSSVGYEEDIERSIAGDARIVRRNGFLEYNDFNNAFREAHFVVFADEQGPSCITNGTLTEALINRRPVICPDYNPYRYYIDRYHVGLMYKGGDVESYAEAMKKAAEFGSARFLPAIDDFLKDIEFHKVAKEFVEAIYGSEDGQCK